MFLEMKSKKLPGTAISVDHRHRSRYYCRAHQFMSSLSSPLRSQVDFPHLYEWESATSASSFMWTKLDALPLSQILQVRVMQCRQWALTGRNINLHLWHGGRNKTLSEPQCGAEVCSVCACRASTFEITNLSAQMTRCERLFLRVGLRFHDERSIGVFSWRLRKHSR